MKNYWKQRTPLIRYDENENIIDKILKIRGIENKQEFLYPSEENIHNPFDLANMEYACNRIKFAIDNSEKIGLYGDPDTDGITSLAEMFKYLKYKGNNAYVYSNQRVDGHGVKADKVIDDISLLIIVDSSTNSVEECKQLKEKGIDIIILDHHEREIENKYPTIVNPQCCDYDNKQLSGAGVVWQCCRGLDILYNDNYAEELVDICALGNIADMMDVTQSETRSIVYKGLNKMQDNPDFNLKLLLKKLNKAFRPNATDVGFYVAPFINSIIRLGDIFDAINIMISEDEKEVKALLKKCGGKNEKRKELQSVTVEEIMKHLDNSHKICIVDTTNIETSTSLNGLIANDLANKNQKPVLVGKVKDGILCGSTRSFGDIPLKEILDKSGLFEMLQGHSGACGFELKIENIQDVYSYVDKELDNLVSEYSVYYDLELNEDDITYDLLRDVQRMSFICGQGFEQPIFLIENLSVNNISSMKDIHMKIKVDDDFDIVKFNVGEEFIENAKESMITDIIANISINSWWHNGLKQTIRTRQCLAQDIDLF